MLRLCTLARLTVVPSSSTGSNTAIGLIRPVRDGLHSIFTRCVCLVSSAHLNAQEFLGNFAVLPSDSPYAISSHRQRPVRLMGNHFSRYDSKTIRFPSPRYLRPPYGIPLSQIPVLSAIPSATHANCGSQRPPPSQAQTQKADIPPGCYTVIQLTYGTAAKISGILITRIHIRYQPVDLFEIRIRDDGFAS